MKETKTVIVHFRVTPTKAREMSLVAKAEGLTQSDLIRKLVDQRAAELAERGR